jgi:hypothetical protein
MKLTILSPVPERMPGATAAPRPRALTDRVRLGLLSNGKPNTSHLLDGIAEVLAADPRFAPAGREQKESASRPADQAIVDRLTAGADLVVGATAD